MRIAVLTLALMLASGAALPASPQMEAPRRLPLGNDALRLEPSGVIIMFYATAECEVCSTAHLVPADAKSRQAVELPANYPQQVNFRVTAESAKRVPENVSPLTHETSEDVNGFLLGLKFQLRFFRGLEMRAVKPRAVRLLGMPAEVPYEERIYSVVFDVGETPIEDRAVLDVLSADGQRLAKFFLVFK